MYFRVAFRLGMIVVLDDIQDIATLDMEDHIFEKYASLGLEFLVLRVVPHEVLQDGHPDSKGRSFVDMYGQWP
jgi:hypothetical protein